MLGCGDGLEVLGVIALEPFAEVDGEAAGEPWVFAVGFLGAAPAGIAGHVDGGRPDDDAAVACAAGVHLGAGFVGDGVADLAKEGGCRWRPYPWLAEDGGGASRRETPWMASGPPVHGFDAETFVFAWLALDLFGFFVEGHAFDEIGDAILEGESNVLVGCIGGDDVGGGGFCREGLDRNP